MSDRTEARDPVARAEEAEAPIDEALEEVFEVALDEASTEEAGELEAVEAGVLADEEQEVSEKTETMIETVLDGEDETAINGGAMLDMFLRRRGVLPERTDTGALDEDKELPAARRDGEFVCSRCFLIKPDGQLGDADGRVCLDCVDPAPAKHVAR